MLPTTYICPSAPHKPHYHASRLELIKVSDLSGDDEVFWCDECELTYDSSEVTPFNRAIELFPGLQIGRKSEYITNTLSGNSAWLPPIAVAVYDIIKGSEMCGIFTTLRQGLDWFIEYYPDEYMKLLD